MGLSSPAGPSAFTTPNGHSRLPSAVDTKTSTPYRRASLLPSARTTREPVPLTPTTSTEKRTQLPDLSPKRSFTTHRKDSELSPKEFLASLDSSTRNRPSFSDSTQTQTPPNRANAYRPSNLHYYSSSREDPQTPAVAPPPEPVSAPSRGDGTESHGSTGAATSVWDELDELKSRIRRIEMGGKIPATSGAVISQAIADRPRTANTAASTVSSSPNQQRKPDPSPAESTVAVTTPSKVHPLLTDALAMAKGHTSPAVYRALETTATEALSLSESAGSATLNGPSLPDRQFRRKADNVCRNLTELCIVLSNTKQQQPNLASPAFRSIAAAPSRRPSVQVNESPTVRPSIEPEGNISAQSSPSTALSRIEARRASMMGGGASAMGGSREPSQEPLTPSQMQMASRVNRAGTSLNKSRQTPEEDEDDEENLTLRAPSRAFTDFRDSRAGEKSRFSRTYTSREPLPDLQPSAMQSITRRPTIPIANNENTTPIRRPTIPIASNENTTPTRRPTIPIASNENTTSLRRPTIPTASNENLLARDGSRRYGIERQSSPAYEKQITREFATPRTPYTSNNRHSVGVVSGLGRSGSLNRRLQGTSTRD